MHFVLAALAVIGAGDAPAKKAEAAPAAAESEKLAFFEKKIRPLFVAKCYGCHSAETKPAGQLRVDDRNGLLAGGNGGAAAIVPGDPGKGLLIARVTQANERRRMPLEGEALSAEEVADLKKWIADGAAWPGEATESSAKPKPNYEKLKREHWAWQPVKSPQTPVVKDQGWPRSEVDRFLLAKLEANGLRPTTDADRATLVRRLHFDLVGLPPTPAEIDAFTGDSSPNATERLVDRLLASPGFGERWGRHWLDVARYGESTGPSRNIPYPHAWKYRDYVIAAVNADVPYDRFLKEQIAGDLLPAATPEERDRLATATGFLALGVKDVNQRFKTRFIMDNVDEQIDVVTRSTLALTVSCARCHDHKFDPIPTADYYSLAGIFTSTENCAGVRNRMGGGGLDYYDPANLVVLSAGKKSAEPSAKQKKLEEEVEKARKEWESIRGTPRGLAKAADGFPTQRPYRLKYEALKGELLALTDPASQGHAVHGARDAKQPGDTQIRLRGEAERLGPTTPRGFLTTFAVPGSPAVNPKSSGRLELAEWLASPTNPLTARVAVNRIWQRLFGAGLVSTADNFGINGDVPSHPELLDHLATRFVADGWSVKRLVRSLALTRAYQLSAESSTRESAADPANRLVWRHSPRRLAAEEVRDAILATAGTLESKRPTGSATRQLRMTEIRDNGAEARRVHEAANESRARSLYLPLLRGLNPQSLECFDPVDQTLVSGVREETNVPSQALFLLNSAFVRKNSLAHAEKLIARGSTDDARIDAAYRAILGRAPVKEEIVRGKDFLAAFEAEAKVARPVQLASAKAKAASPSGPASEPKPKAAKGGKAGKRKAKAAAETAAKSIADAAGEQGKDSAKEVPPKLVPIVDPDQADTSGDPIFEAGATVSDPRTAAWLGFVQALYGSAEFRYVR